MWPASIIGASANLVAQRQMRSRRLCKRITSAVTLITLAVSTSLRAGESALEWTAPVQNTDGSAPTNLAGFRIHYGRAADQLSQTITINNPALSTYLVEGLGTGQWYFAMIAYNTAGAESVRSGVVSDTILADPPPPNAPMAPVVRPGATIAYTIVKRVNGFVLLPVGTVPANTQCDPAQSVNGRYVVPRAAVTWSGSTRPDVVVADCS